MNVRMSFLLLLLPLSALAQQENLYLHTLFLKDGVAVHGITGFRWTGQSAHKTFRYTLLNGRTDSIPATRFTSLIPSLPHLFSNGETPPFLQFLIETDAKTSISNASALILRPDSIHFSVNGASQTLPWKSVSTIFLTGVHRTVFDPAPSRKQPLLTALASVSQRFKPGKTVVLNNAEWDSKPEQARYWTWALNGMPAGFPVAVFTASPQQDKPPSSKQWVVQKDINQPESEKSAPSVIRQALVTDAKKPAQTTTPFYPLEYEVPVDSMRAMVSITSINIIGLEAGSAWKNGFSASAFRLAFSDWGGFAVRKRLFYTERTGVGAGFLLTSAFRATDQRQLFSQVAASATIRRTTLFANATHQLRSGSSYAGIEDKVIIKTIGSVKARFDITDGGFLQAGWVAWHAKTRYESPYSWTHAPVFGTGFRNRRFAVSVNFNLLDVSEDGLWNFSLMMGL